MNWNPAQSQEIVFLKIKIESQGSGILISTSFKMLSLWFAIFQKEKKNCANDNQKT